MSANFKMLAKTFFGFEDLLEQELKQMGAQDVEKGNRVVQLHTISLGTLIFLPMRPSQLIVSFLEKPLHIHSMFLRKLKTRLPISFAQLLVFAHRLI
jgi:hypothetical protein